MATYEITFVITTPITARNEEEAKRTAERMTHALQHGPMPLADITAMHYPQRGGQVPLPPPGVIYRVEIAKEEC